MVWIPSGYWWHINLPPAQISLFCLLGLLGYSTYTSNSVFPKLSFHPSPPSSFSSCPSYTSQKVLSLVVYHHLWFFTFSLLLYVICNQVLLIIPSDPPKYLWNLPTALHTQHHHSRPTSTLPWSSTGPSSLDHFHAPSHLQYIVHTVARAIFWYNSDHVTSRVKPLTWCRELLLTCQSLPTTRSTHHYSSVALTFFSQCPGCAMLLHSSKPPSAWNSWSPSPG